MLVVANFLDSFFIAGVFDGVVAEVKAFGHMDAAPEPLREVGVVEPAETLRVLVHHQLFEVVEIQIFFVSKVLEHVFNRYEPVSVRVQF